MRHRKSGRHLNRTSSHRKAMMSNMSASLIEHESIQTTVVKAKELRRYVEPLITLSKVDSVANRRRAFAKLRNPAAVGKLFTVLGPRYSDRPGGYTRILKAGFRRGDATGIAHMQLMDAELKVKEKLDEGVFEEEQQESGEEVVEAEEQASVDEASAEETTATTSDESSEVSAETVADEESSSDAVESSTEESDPVGQAESPATDEDELPKDSSSTNQEPKP